MAIDLIEIEGRLIGALHAYLKDRTCPPEVSSELEMLLGMHWKAERLPADHWFDGIEDLTWRIRKGGRVEARGVMIWGDGQWVELFGGDFRIAANGRALALATLRFGRKDEPSRRIPYDRAPELHRELRRPNRWEWAYVFRKDRAQVT